MAIQTKTAMSVDEYFEWELQQERKHEYIDGEVIEMPGVSFNHDIIVSNLIYIFVNCLDRARFRFHTAELRVQAGPSRYVYPDLTIVRGPSVASDVSEYNLINPYVVLEVTSPSSMDRDRVDKLSYYFEAPSINACLIVDQHRVCAELYTRGDSGWQRQVFTEPGEVIPLAMLDCELPLDQVYLGIDLEET